MIHDITNNTNELKKCWASISCSAEKEEGFDEKHKYVSYNEYYDFLCKFANETNEEIIATIYKLIGITNCYSTLLLHNVEHRVIFDEVLQKTIYCSDKTIYTDIDIANCKVDVATGLDSAVKQKHGGDKQCMN